MDLFWLLSPWATPALLRTPIQSLVMGLEIWSVIILASSLWLLWRRPWDDPR